MSIHHSAKPGPNIKHSYTVVYAFLTGKMLRIKRKNYVRWWGKHCKMAVIHFTPPTLVPIKTHQYGMQSNYEWLISELCFHPLAHLLHGGHESLGTESNDGRQSLKIGFKS